MGVLRKQPIAGEGTHQGEKDRWQEKRLPEGKLGILVLSQVQKEGCSQICLYDLSGLTITAGPICNLQMIQLAFMACVLTQHSPELASVDKNGQKYLVLVLLSLGSLPAGVHLPSFTFHSLPFSQTSPKDTGTVTCLTSSTS